MKILLTGATGFVGRNLLLDLLRDDAVEKVAACVRHGGRMLSLLAEEDICGLPSKLELIQGSDQDWGLGQLSFVPDVAVHTAGVLFARSAEAYHSCNVEGTRRLLQALPANCRTVILSSQSAVGPTPAEQSALREDAACHPLSDYGKSKLAMEEMLTQEFATDRPMVILRPPMVLGPRDSATRPLFHMARGILWVKPGSRTKQLSWIGVHDLVRAIRLVLARWEVPVTPPTKASSPVVASNPSKPPTYFVCSSAEITDRELIETTARVLQSRGLLLALPDGILRLVGGLSRWIPAIGKAVPSLQPDRLKELLEWKWVISDAAFREDFSWKSRDKLPEVLAQTAQWLQARGFLPTKQ